jgi:hypothetical protein
VAAAHKQSLQNLDTQRAAHQPCQKTNREGTGVQPDVEVPAERALKTSHFMVIEWTMEGNLIKKDELQDIIEELKREIGRTQKED